MGAQRMYGSILLGCQRTKGSIEPTGSPMGSRNLLGTCPLSLLEEPDELFKTSTLLMRFEA